MTTLDTLATDARRLGNHSSGETYAARAKEARDQTALARQFLADVVRWR